MTHVRQGHGAQADCAKEQLVVNAVLSGRWPQGCDDSLVSHAKECMTCREVADVSLLLREDSEDSRFEMHVPAAGQIWWRAAVRARLEGTTAAVRPITWMHGITGAVAVGVLMAVITAAWAVLPDAIDSARTTAMQFLPSAEAASALTSLLKQSLLIAGVAATLLIVAPLALYFVLSDD
ncbi:MAG: hypothetical protein K2Y23_19740 [Cyanobacteria bacterium]|nr:hypothetical protein [Cyanobacteriota bacterium]